MAADPKPASLALPATSTSTAQTMRKLLDASHKLDRFRPAAAGLLGGATSTLVLHPLDLLKTRQAVHANCTGAGELRRRYARVGSAFREVLRSGGGVRGLYAGVGTNVALSGTSWGVYFMAYGHLKSCFPADDCATPLGAAGAQLFATFGAGAATTVLTNPLSVLRTRIVMSPVTLSPVSALRGVLRDGGVRALFTRGLGPSLCGVSHGAAQIIFYERIKTEVLRRRGRKTGKMSTCETLGACTLSKLGAALLTYPCQNLRACQQAAAPSSGPGKGRKVTMLGVLRGPLGARGLYAGLAPYLMHVVPNVCVVFLVYEALVG